MQRQVRLEITGAIRHAIFPSTPCRNWSCQRNARQTANDCSQKTEAKKTLKGLRERHPGDALSCARLLKDCHCCYRIETHVLECTHTQKKANLNTKRKTPIPQGIESEARASQVKTQITLVAYTSKVLGKVHKRARQGFCFANTCASLKNRYSECDYIR